MPRAPLPHILLYPHTPIPRSSLSHTPCPLPLIPTSPHHQRHHCEASCAAVTNLYFWALFLPCFQISDDIFVFQRAAGLPVPPSQSKRAPGVSGSTLSSLTDPQQKLQQLQAIGQTEFLCSWKRDGDAPYLNVQCGRREGTADDWSKAVDEAWIPVAGDADKVLLTAVKRYVKLTQSHATMTGAEPSVNVKDLRRQPGDPESDAMDEELTQLGVMFTIVKILYQAGCLPVLPALCALIEPARRGLALHTTVIRNEQAYYTTIVQTLDAKTQIVRQAAVLQSVKGAGDGGARDDAVLGGVLDLPWLQSQTTRTLFVLGMCF